MSTLWTILNKNQMLHLFQYKHQRSQPPDQWSRTWSTGKDFVRDESCILSNPSLALIHLLMSSQLSESFGSRCIIRESFFGPSVSPGMDPTNFGPSRMLTSIIPLSLTARPFMPLVGRLMDLIFLVHLDNHSLLMVNFSPSLSSPFPSCPPSSSPSPSLHALPPHHKFLPISWSKPSPFPLPNDIDVAWAM